MTVESGGNLRKNEQKGIRKGVRIGQLIEEGIQETKFWRAMRTAEAIHSCILKGVVNSDYNDSFYRLRIAVQASLAMNNEAELKQMSKELEQGWGQKLMMCYGYEAKTPFFINRLNEVLEARSTPMISDL